MMMMMMMMMGFDWRMARLTEIYLLIFQKAFLSKMWDSRETETQYHRYQVTLGYKLASTLDD